MSKKNQIRIFVPSCLAQNHQLLLTDEQSHYLCNVMRKKNGDEILCFNAQDGEFLARVVEANKKQTKLQILSLARLPQKTPDVWLVLAPLKKNRTDFLIEKAVELGVSKIIPIFTRFGITDKIRPERIKAQLVEAAEQCERFDVPVLEEMSSLNELLKKWPKSRKLFFMDETKTGWPAVDAFGTCKNLPAALLIGPEGGFAPDESVLLRNQPFVCPVSLGPRILRAETAAAAALAVWQAIAGDWKE